ncbi:MAG: LacI family DNA-binding transcriptional regulator [Phycisphaeraceae bacterium JB051]
MVTLKDIADHCDLSISLVSKVLNNRMGTSGAKQHVVESIRKAAQDLGYRKNLSAQALRSGRHNVIGVMMHHFGRPGTGLVEAMLLGISQACSDSHQSQTLTFYQNADEFRASIKNYHPGTMDGIIIAGLAHPELAEDIRTLVSSHFPIVSIHPAPIPDLKIPNVGIDETRIAELATTHLLEQGCQNLVYIGNHISERTQGFIKAMKQHGKTTSDQQIIDCGWSFENAYQAAQQLIASGMTFDGIATECDESATGILAALMDHDYKVPQDVRVIGIDNSPYCQFQPVTLSSIGQCPMRRGKAAVDMLNQIITRQATVASQVFEPELFARNSTR